MGIVKWNAYLKLRHICQHHRICQRKDLVAFRQVHRAEHFVNANHPGTRKDMRSGQSNGRKFLQMLSKHASIPIIRNPLSQAALDSRVVHFRTHAACHNRDDHTWLHKLYNSVTESKL
jgi:hypothetical protein